MENKVIIPFRLPSLNNYILECRKNKYAGANMKKKIEEIKIYSVIDIIKAEILRFKELLEEE